MLQRRKKPRSLRLRPHLNQPKIHPPPRWQGLRLGLLRPTLADRSQSPRLSSIWAHRKISHFCTRKPIPQQRRYPPAQTAQPTPAQPPPTDRPGSSTDGVPDLSSADPARVYMPQAGQDIDVESFRALLQPGAFTKPYLFDVDLLDRRAQPLFGQPTYKPIECMIFDGRPWICFYGGSMPTSVAETDGYWYTMYASDGGCCLPGWPVFLLQDFVNLFADPPPSPQPTTKADDAASNHSEDFVRARFPLPGNYRPSFGRYWHLGCAGTHNPRSMDPPNRPPTVQIARDLQPMDLVHGRKGNNLPFPSSPWVLEQPRLPPRVEAKPLKGCLCLPAMVLPESYSVNPAFARAYYMGNDNKMHCLLPCSTEPFCPFHSACGRLMNPDSLEHSDDHKGHLCSRCKEFLDKDRTPFEWFDSLPDAISKD